MIEIGEIRIKGFGPYLEETKFNFNNPGLTLIKAPNGSGKTKLISALHWGLYGDTLGEHTVEPWPFIIDEFYEGTKVEVDVIKDKSKATIIRCSNFKGRVHGAKGGNRVLFIKDGETAKGGKKEINKIIEEYIGYSSDLFLTSVLFGQKLQRFISHKGPKKKELFDEAFTIQWVTQAKKLKESELVQVREAFVDQQAKVEKLKDKVSEKEDFYNDLLEIKTNFDKTKADNIKEIKKAIAKLKKEREKEENKLITIDEAVLEDKKIERDNLSSKIESYEQAYELKVDLTHKVEVAQSELWELDRQISELEAHLGSLPNTCPDCGKPYSKKEKAKKEKDFKNSLNEVKGIYKDKSKKLNTLKKEKTDAEKQYASLLSNKERIKSLKEDIKLLENSKNNNHQVEWSIQSYTKNIENKNKELIKEKKRKNDADPEKYRKAIEKDKKELEPELRVLKKLQVKIDHLEWMIKDPLSNSGIKSYIFDAMMGELNQVLDSYKEYTGFKVALEVDMDSAHKNIDQFILKDGEPIPYKDLSGGQQQLVDVVTAFSIHKVVNKGKDINLLILDEVFESLDPTNIEIVMQLIEKIALNKHVYLITHDPNFSPRNVREFHIKYKDYKASIAA